MAVLFSILLYGKRGWGVAAVGAFGWGAVAVVSFIDRNRWIGWNTEHPVLDGAMFGSLLFVGLAFITDMPTLVCVAIAVVGCALLLAVGSLLRARRAM